jgi:hypothetical protein
MSARPCLLGIWVAALSAGLASAQQSVQPEGGFSSDAACGSDPKAAIQSIFDTVANKVLPGSTGAFTDPKYGRPVELIFDPARRFSEFDCDKGAVQDSDSIAATTSCPAKWLVVFGFGICEAAKNKDGIAFVISHELSHILLDHIAREEADQAEMFKDWIAGPGQPDYQELRAAADARVQARVDLEHPEFSRGDHPPEGFVSFMDHYTVVEAQELTDALMARFQEKDAKEINENSQGYEKAADRRGLLAMSLAGFDTDRASDMIRQYGQLRASTDLKADFLHPPIEDRAKEVDAVLARLRARGLIGNAPPQP